MSDPELQTLTDLHIYGQQPKLKMAYNALEICGLSLLLVTSEISPIKISKWYPLDK